MVNPPGQVTREDEQRTELYRQNALRRAERDRHPQLAEFLEALKVRSMKWFPK
jgi:predicted enzyme involved in methoxymalonyl-ACP biosynthesis